MGPTPSHHPKVETLNFILLAGLSMSGKSQLRKRLCSLAPEGLESKRMRKVPYRDIKAFSRAPVPCFKTNFARWADLLAAATHGGKVAEEALCAEASRVREGYKRSRPECFDKIGRLMRALCDAHRNASLILEDEDGHRGCHRRAMCAGLLPSDTSAFILLETSYSIYEDRYSKAEDRLEGRKHLEQPQFLAEQREAARQFPREQEGLDERIWCRVDMPPARNMPGVRMMTFRTDTQYVVGFRKVVTAIVATFPSVGNPS